MQSRTGSSKNKSKIIYQRIWSINVFRYKIVLVYIQVVPSENYLSAMIKECIETGYMTIFFSIYLKSRGL